MSLDLYALLAIIVVMVGAVIWIARISNKARDAEVQREVLDDVDEANEIDRTVDREPDPVGRLRERWRKP